MEHQEPSNLLVALFALLYEWTKIEVSLLLLQLSNYIIWKIYIWAKTA